MMLDNSEPQQEPEEFHLPEPPAPPPTDDDSGPPPFDPPLDEARMPAWVQNRSARRENDALFFYAVLMAVNVGLSPLAADAPVDRYTILWTLLAVIGVGHFALNREAYDLRVTSDDLSWGAAFGFILGIPLLLVGQPLLSEASRRIFFDLPNGAVFQALVFVMPLAETMFFRGMVQQVQSWPVTAGMASAWSILMFFPVQDLREFLPIALTIGTFTIMLNVLFSYVRQRNGLAAAWVCQVIVGLLWLFVPLLFA